MASPSTAHRVWPRCSGPVGLAEMNSMLIRLPGQRLGAPVGRAGRDDVRGDLALGAGVDGDVEEAGAGDLDGGDALGCAQPRATSSANARGLVPAFLASWSATLVA